LVLQSISLNTIKKYSEILLRIPDLLKDIIDNYENINFDTVSRFQAYLQRLKESLKDINFESSDNEELQVRNTVNYYLNSFRNFFDIGITRLIESLIGMV